MTSRRLVQAAHYGIGVIFPVVVLDERPRWHRPAPQAVPEQLDADSGEVLALRWTGHASALHAAPAVLLDAAQRVPAPPTEAALAEYRSSLPSRLSIITLPPWALIGPWSDRPGRGHLLG